MQCEFVRALDLTAALLALSSQPSALIERTPQLTYLHKAVIGQHLHDCPDVVAHAAQPKFLVVTEHVGERAAFELYALHRADVGEKVVHTTSLLCGLVLFGLETELPHYRLHPPACSLRLLQSCQLADECVEYRSEDEHQHNHGSENTQSSENQ
jgi:hypothetical protein